MVAKRNRTKGGGRVGGQVSPYLLILIPLFISYQCHGRQSNVWMKWVEWILNFIQSTNGSARIRGDRYKIHKVEHEMGQYLQSYIDNSSSSVPLQFLSLLLLYFDKTSFWYWNCIGLILCKYDILALNRYWSDNRMRIRQIQDKKDS